MPPINDLFPELDKKPYKKKCPTCHGSGKVISEAKRRAGRKGGRRAVELAGTDGTMTMRERTKLGGRPKKPPN